MTSIPFPETKPVAVERSLSTWRLGSSTLYWLLALLTLLAAGLRFYKLGAWSFWGDEFFTISLREDGFNESIWRSSLASTLIQWSVAALGTSEWSARIVPAIIGVLSVPLLFFPLRKMIGSSGALFAVAFLAISPWHLYWSQNARFYSLLLLFYTLALAFAYLGFEHDRPHYLLLSLLFLGLAARERLLALFFVPVVLSYLVLVSILPFAKPAGWRLRNLALFLGPASVGALLFAAPYLRNLERWMTGFGQSNNSAFWLAAGVIYYVGLPVVIMATAGAVYWIGQGHRAALLWALNALIPLLVLMAIAHFHYTANRYAFVSLLGWLALAAMAVQRLLAVAHRRATTLAAGVLLILLATSLGDDILYFQFQNGNRDNWRAAFAYIKSHAQGGDLVLSSAPQMGNYYMQDATTSIATFQPDLPLESPDETNQTNSQIKRIWFVEDMIATRDFPHTTAWFQSHARQVADFDVHVYARNFRMRVYLFEPGSPTLP